MSIRQKIAMIAVCAAAVLLVIAGIVAEWMLVRRPVIVPEKATVLIHGGMNATEIAQELKQMGLIRNVDYFIDTAVHKGYATRFKEGKFQVSGTVTAPEMAYLLTQTPQIPNVKVTIPEGLTIDETASCLIGYARIDSVEFVRLAADSSLARALGVDTPTLEGYLFPDTYYISEMTDARAMVGRMVNQFHAVFSDSLRLRAQTLHLSVHDVVTLASIVQLETGLHSELPMVSQVFHSRLEKRWRLEANPTIQYIIGKRRVLLADLELESPFNTYLHTGLPPGPIASPGRDALYATLYPSDTEYLFFMADGYGGHIFSSTLEEHNRAVGNYRQVRETLSVQ